MITKQQASELKHGDIIHSSGRKASNGACQRWRVSGMVKTWKLTKNVDRFRMPVKHGLYDNGYVDEDNNNSVHLVQDCENPKQ